jgi:uncharacterized protein
MSNQTRSFRRSIIAVSAAFFVGVAALTGGATSTAAQSRLLDEARVAGTVGERYDGTATVRAGAPASAQNTVNSVNTKRMDIYKKRAASEGITAEAVGRIYAKQIYENAPSGTWFLLQSGQWVRK